ncbi:MAG: hypothetical protein PWQ70_1470 [Clostridiales bacterium]|jgi:hypothetical protein|nr:hypothetical protein [Clostridiales bacterium]
MLNIYAKKVIIIYNMIYIDKQRKGTPKMEFIKLEFIYF